MLATPFSLPPAAADLKDLLVSCGKHTLHAEFRRGMEKPRTGRDGVDVGFGWRGRDTVRRLDFQISPADEKLSCALNDSRSLPERLLATGQGPVYHHVIIP